MALLKLYMILSKINKILKSVVLNAESRDQNIVYSRFVNIIFKLLEF